MKIAFSGTRKLLETDRKKVWNDLDCRISRLAAVQWHVGDAPGLDALIRSAAPYYDKALVVHKVKYRKKWGFAERSQRMIDAISNSSDNCLFAFPNKPCPEKCTPRSAFSGHGSGTWGTVAYAKKKGVNVYLLPLIDLKIFPDWLISTESCQLSLF